MKSKMDEDQRARLRAIEPDKSFIVKAPAGSGKTGLLVKRYLRLLSLAESPEEVVAITFTRKASTEMRNQIQDALESALTKKKPENEHEEDRIKFATDVLKQDKKKKVASVRFTRSFAHTDHRRVIHFFNSTNADIGKIRRTTGCHGRC